MSIDNFGVEEIITDLTKNLNFLVDEVKLLSERHSLLEEKLIFACKQYQILAEKHAAGDSKTLSILTELQFPPKISTDNAWYVRSPELAQTSTGRITALAQNICLIKDRLAIFVDKLSGSTLSVKCTSSTRCELQKSQSNILEKDPIVSEEKIPLDCPFSHSTQKPKLPDPIKTSNLRVKIEPRTSEDNRKSTSGDPQGSAGASPFGGTKIFPNTALGRSKCPIRFLGQRSPEEVAKYFETHKHEIPRSHEICVKQQQKNEDHIRKLDEKYGNLVNMIEELGQKHQPLLPDDQENVETVNRSNKSLENWVHNVSFNEFGQEYEEQNTHDQSDRESKFDRPMKEVRVGESPSRPWGISVPINNILRGQISESSQPSPVPPKDFGTVTRNSTYEVKRAATPSAENLPNQSFVSDQPHHSTSNVAPTPPGYNPSVPIRSFIQTNQAETRDLNNPSEIQNRKNVNTIPQVSNTQMSQMTFTGPVFIGYSTEDAIRLVQQLK